MKNHVLVTKRIYTEAVDLLRQHAEVDYVSSDDGLSPEDLAQRVRGKQAIVSQLTDRFDAAVIESLDNNLSKSPKNDNFRYQLGMALYQKGDKVKAKQEPKAALTNNPSKEEEASIRELIGKI